MISCHFYDQRLMPSIAFQTYLGTGCRLPQAPVALKYGQAVRCCATPEQSSLTMTSQDAPEMRSLRRPTGNDVLQHCRPVVKAFNLTDWIMLSFKIAWRMLLQTVKMPLERYLHPFLPYQRTSNIQSLIPYILMTG